MYSIYSKREGGYEVAHKIIKSFLEVVIIINIFHTLVSCEGVYLFVANQVMLIALVITLWMLVH